MYSILSLWRRQRLNCCSGKPIASRPVKTFRQLSNPIAWRYLLFMILLGQYCAAAWTALNTLRHNAPTSAAETNPPNRIRLRLERHCQKARGCIYACKSVARPPAGHAKLISVKTYQLSKRYPLQSVIRGSCALATSLSKALSESSSKPFKFVVSAGDIVPVPNAPYSLWRKLDSKSENADRRNVAYLSYQFLEPYGLPELPVLWDLWPTWATCSPRRCSGC